jgi:hypothetical protein
VQSDSHNEFYVTGGLKPIALGQFIQLETRLKVYCSQFVCPESRTCISVKKSVVAMVVRGLIKRSRRVDLLCFRFGEPFSSDQRAVIPGVFLFLRPRYIPSSFIIKVSLLII